MGRVINMNASGEDNRSVRFTKRRIKTAFFELIHDKNIQKITITEIIRKADISRGTFYFHYTDIYDLIRKIEEDIITDVINEIKNFDESKYVVGEFPIAKRVFDVFDTHANEITLLLGENGDPGFYEIFQIAISNYFKDILNLFVSTDYNNLDNVLIFLISGILNMFLYNKKSDNPSDNETLAMIANRYLRASNKLIGLSELEPDL